MKKEELKQILEIESSDEADQLVASGKYRFHNFSERRDKYILVKRSKNV